MGVYIKGMEMPPSGTFNIVHIHYDGKVFMPAWGKGMQQVKGVEAIPVPPHGRLIDADTMEKTMSDTVQGDIRGYPYSDTLWDTAFRWIDNQPTIIEEDRGDDE